MVLFFLACQLGWAADLEVRAYRAELDSFRVFDVESEVTGFDFEKAEIFVADELVKPSFESRFFTKGGRYLDYSEWARKVGLFQEGEGEAVYDLGSGRLVARAKRGPHVFLYDLLGGALETQLKVTISVEKLKGVQLGRPDFSKAEGREILASLTGLTVGGRSMELRSPDGKLMVEAEFQSGGHRDGSWESRFNLRSLLPGAEVELKTGLSGVFGAPAMVELGSLDGLSTLVAKVSVARVLSDGSFFVDWVHRENGKGVVKEQRRAKLLNFDRDYQDLGDGRGVELFDVPPTFWTFLAGEDGRNKTLRELFKENGVSLKKEDRLFWLPGGSSLAVEADKVSLEMISGITMAAGQFGPAPVLAVHFSELESEKKLGGEDLAKGQFRTVREISVTGLPGQSARVDLGNGKGKLKAVAEMQSSSSDDFLEVRSWFQGKGQGKQDVVIDAKVGVPLLIRQEKVGERWRAWVAVFSAQGVEQMVKEAQ